MTSFTYDAMGRVTQTAFPSSYAESYGYDGNGNLLSKTDRKGQTIQYVYDGLNRLIQKSYPDSTSVEYVYDLVGKIRQVADRTGSYGFAYDNMGRLIGTVTQYAFSPTTPFSTIYTYDAASNRTSLIAPDDSTTTYNYDTLNRLSGLTSSLSGQFGFGYDALSRRTSLTRPNGVNTSYSYDSLSRLLSVLHQAGGTTIDGASYTYDFAGNRTSKTNYLDGTTSNYSYDPLYQLTQVTQGNVTTESYSYDPVGNRLSSLGVPLYSYNSANELTSTSNGSYTYDANGNTLSNSDSGGTTQYSWDFDNRLTQVTLPGDGGTVTFQYDPFGRRIQKSSTTGATNYLYDGNNDIEEVDNSGNVLARYTDGQRIDEPLAELRSGNTSFYEQDGLASVVSLSNGTGSLSGTYVYDSFGNLTASTGTVKNSFRYTGREFDQETGGYYYRARYYGQDIGRFNSGDPLRFTAGVNFFAYTWNNPTNYNDPFGLCPPRVPNHITCDTVLPNGQTVGDWVRQLSDAINQAVENGFTGYGPSPGLSPDLIAQQVYSSTNFRVMFGGPGANYSLLGDLGNFAYGAVSADIGVPLWLTEMAAGGYSLLRHPSADWGWPWGMDPSAQVQVPAGYKAKCTK